MPNQRLIGKKAEDVACNFLLQHGLQLVERNYSCRFGEIDLIMRDCDNTLVFVEVRYRNSYMFGGPIESINRNKRQKLIFTANHYIQKFLVQQPSRFDVVALIPQQPPVWISNAFSENLS